MLNALVVHVLFEKAHDVSFAMIVFMVALLVADVPPVDGPQTVPVVAGQPALRLFGLDGPETARSP